MDPSSGTLKTTYLSPPTSDPEDGTETDWQNYYNVTNTGPQNAANVQIYSNVVENSWKTTNYPDALYKVKVKTYAYPTVENPTPASTEAVRVVGTDNYRPYVEQVELWNSQENTVYLRKWAPEGTVLKSSVASVEQPILPGVYKAIITFSEHITEPSVWLQLGANIETNKRDDFIAHKSILEGNISIFGDAYPHDAVARLMVRSSDTAGNALLELAPERTTINTALERTRNAAGDMQGIGGVDQLHSLHIEVSPPAIAWETLPWTFSTPCYGGCNTEPDPVYFSQSTVTFKHSDLGAGLAEILVHKDSLTGEIIQQMVFQNRVYEQLASFTLPDGKYVQTVRDNLDKTSTIWFVVDTVSPRLEVTGIDIAQNFSVFSASGVVQDTGSGMDRLTLSMGGTHLADINLPSGITEQVPYNIPGLPAVTPAYYVFSAQDRALNLTPNILAQFDTYNGEVSNYLGGDEPYVVGRHVTRIKASGRACSITVSASPNTFNIPINYQVTTNAINTSLTQDTTYPVTVFSGSEYMHGKLSVVVPQECHIDTETGHEVCNPICNATVETTNLASLLLGPRVSIWRNGDALTGSDVKFDYGWITMIFHNLKVKLGETPNLTTELAAAPTPLPGYVVYPPGISRGWRIKYTGVSYDNVEVTVHGLPSGLSQEARAGFIMRHYKEDGTWEDIPTTSTENSITGISPGNNLFVLLAPLSIYDKSGPVTTFETRTYEKDGRIYVSSANPVALYSVDISSDSNALAGVASTYYLLDAEPTPECLAAAYNPSAASGTCQNPLYNGPFQVSEGVRSLYCWAVDKIGNVGAGGLVELRVDGTPPVSALEINSNMIAAGSTVYATTADVITLVAADTVSNGVASGLTTTYFLVDVSNDNCGYMDWFGGVNGMGTCANRFYGGPFSLPAGEHVISFQSEDNAGNLENLKTVYFNVSAPAQTYLPITPSSGPIGVPFTIEGAGFGAYSAGATVVLVGGATAPLTLWTDIKIQGTVPGILSAGQQPVSVRRGSTVLAEVYPFTVTLPALYTLTPASGAIGVPFTITGESFGNYVANYTRVLLGGATVPLTLWTDTKIQGTIPGTLPVGDYELVVERSLNGGLVRTSTAAFSLRNMEAYWLAPSSGPIGMPFTITGAGFGNYSAAYTHVLVGDTTAPLTLWTDTKIQGTVPGNLASGQYPVVVERRTLDGGLMRTAPMAFEVVSVDVASMTPVSGPIGMPFTIYGNNFGNYVANHTRVLIGGTTSPLALWTASKIQGTIPGALSPGEYPVIVERELNGGIVQSLALSFTVSVPAAYNISPSSGPIGMPFTINGANFGNYSAAYTGVLINGATVPLTLWTDVKIQGTIPGSLASGQYPVVVGRRTADGGAVQTDPLIFEVAGVNISSIAPTAGPIGMPFTIYGGNFGNYSAGYTKALIGGIAAPLTLWTDSKIQGTIPGSLAAGDYPVVVERTLNGGQVQSSTLTWTLTLPAMVSVSPSSGPIGLPFTIMGVSFGNYVADYTKVLIGGATAPLTLWTDTKIQGTIPGLLATGDYEMYVERALNGGVVRTASSVFTVAQPVLETVSPSTAAVIAPFTLTGYNFGNYVPNYTSVLINGTTSQLTLWTDTKIQGKLPFLLAGEYPVQVQRYLNGGLAESATGWINIEEPVISSMTPVSGPVGTVFNLYGTGFGPYDASLTRVNIGGVACALSLWTDTRITGTVPSALSYGTHTVVASRGQALSNGIEYVVPGGYTPTMYRAGTLSAEFKLGEVYVYPNPAKGGKVPTFHIEVGTADSVKIKVFTVAGQFAHEKTITGNPQVIGSVYAYEYAWEGRIASGVYYYTMEAEKAGKKIKAKGKFAVVR
ncbi:MAG: IPT/TIG domain-containing protein [Elusimicrobiota bacterium]|nr:IPT/TIG domain-containing protein [Elusimicrobiota bacterium]